MPICKSCGQDKEIHAQGLCKHCYWREYQADKRKREKRRLKKQPIFPQKISPRKMMHMNPGQIVANWKRILKGAGL